MVIFRDEQNLLETLDRHDALLTQCSQGEITFERFLVLYDNFPWKYALDGHESDQEERDLLLRHSRRVKIHLDLASDILSRLCSEEDQDKIAYIEAGRFGSKGAMPRIQEFVKMRL